MTKIDIQFDDVAAILDKYVRASRDLDSDISDAAPVEIQAGEASDVAGAVLFALLNAVSTLSLYGQGLAAQGQAAVDDLRGFDADTAESLAQTLDDFLSGE